MRFLPLLQVLAGLWVAAGVAAGQTTPDRDGAAFYEQNVRPLLAAKCYSCHSARARTLQGALRLDDPEGWLRRGAQGPVIVPRDPNRSRLILAVRHQPGAPAMPPTGTLSDQEIAALMEWIRRGAPAPIRNPQPAIRSSAWWSFQPLRRVAPPAIRNPQSAIRNPIDSFILAKLREKGLRPTAPADRRTLIRRVTYDLTGLPPTPAEVEAFIADRRPDAYERLVDRLLASPRYGERLARHWLDIAHYADTHGYDKDKRRDNAWPYRDYVIRAFNTDKPYDRFIREQIAGDVLYPNDPDGIVATGFIAAGPWDFVGHVELAEGTVEKEKTRLLDRDDMVATTMGVFNSVTIHCARCHDHKFDPIAQRDYYRLQAVFAGIDRGDKSYDPGPGATLPASGISPSNGYHSAIEAKPDSVKWVQIDLGRSMALNEIRLIPARPTDFADTPGFGFPVRYRVEASDEPSFAAPILIADNTSSDRPNPGDRVVTIAAGGRTARYMRITATRLWKRSNDYVFALAELQAISGGRNAALGAKVTAADSIEQGRWSTKFLTDGFDSRVSLTPKTYAVVPHAPRPIHVLARGELEQQRDLVGPGTLACVSGMKPDLTVRDPDNEGSRRAALADWIASPKNPLTWRSIVNRVWQYHFGRGLVDTPSDFGRNGSLPSHPELLDWLASGFSGKDEGERMKDESGRPYPSSFILHPLSLKSLHRLILTSEAYRRSSVFDPICANVDADNRLLWRMERRRLDAEEIRDSVLAVCGSLDLTMGGPGFEPFRFKDDHSPIYDHTDAARINDPATWRRSIYRFTVRSVPHPFLEVLDSPDPNTSTPVRSSTITALQSLSLLNDPFIVRQSERFAGRLRAASTDDSRQIESAFRLVYGRPPSGPEGVASIRYMAQHGLENLCRVLLNANEFVFVD